LEELPENIQRTLMNIIEDLKPRESVRSIGLFGSWSRGDATPSSDVDLLVVDGRNLSYEYVERAEIDNVFLDLNYIPEKWILQEFPPEIDQKIYESKTLYDPDGTLERAKNTMQKIMWLPERVEIRTSSYIVKADTLLSRGLSAYGREDYQSAKLNATLGLEIAMRIVMDVTKTPFSNSRFIRALEGSVNKLDLREFYDCYLEVTGLSNINRRNADAIFKTFKEVWSVITDFVEANSSTAKNLHEKILSNLNFYCKRSFLRGIITRTESLLQDNHVEASHYMLKSSASMLENFAWLLAEIEGIQFDYTRLIGYLKNSKISPKKVYDDAVEILMIKDVSLQDAQAALEKSRETILKIRDMRRELIAEMSTE